MRIAISLLCVVLFPASNVSAETVRVMSYNLWVGGDAGKQPLERSVAVIKAAKADVVGLQETAGRNRADRAREIAKQLGWNFVDQGGRTAIISRFKIVKTTTRKWGAQLALPSGAKIWVFNCHFAPAPYQPYQLLRIPYGKGKFITTAAEAVKEANAARGAQVRRMLAEVKPVLADKVPIFITGDFNEPSHLDWTAAAAKKKLCPVAVAWPASSACAKVGFIDAYRAVHPDPVKNRGLTWTPITKITDPKDRHDRIDFVLAGGVRMKIEAAQVIGESKANADVVVKRYPSDHRAVVAQASWK